MNLVLAVTTYNRKDRLEILISSFLETRAEGHTWKVIVADDGSSDETMTYLTSIAKSADITVINNSRKGVHHQFNSIIRLIETERFDYCFKCDDDIEFLKSGWDELYIDAIQASGYDHLCFFDPTWRPEKALDPPVEMNSVISRCRGKDVQGAFFTLTPEVVRKVGFMDVRNFGFRGVGHIDYTFRACRMGFNDINNPFDAKGSDRFIRSQSENYESSLPEELLIGLEDELETKRKYALINEPRTYIPFSDEAPSLDATAEKVFLTRAVQSLTRQKQWYEEEIRRLKEWQRVQYDHLPGWFLRIGKIFKLFN